MKIPPLLKLALDLGPLLIFFGANAFFGIFVATGTFMVAMIVTIGTSFAIERKVSPVPLITGVLVLVFGGLTLWLANDVFIKIKPTILYTLFAAILLGGLAYGRVLLKYAFGQAFQLDEQGWRALTWRWAVFFAVLAVLNEIVWRSFSTNIWVAFKVWGIVPLILLFSVAQIPFIARHQITSDETPPHPES
jgi:intracellular septation protein